MEYNTKLAEHELGNAALVGANQVGSLDDNTGLCILCRQITEYKCDRCGDFYCSELCQRKDWQSHRYICFPIPKLVKSVVHSVALQEDTVRDEFQLRIPSKPLTTSSMPPTGSRVIVTAFKSTNRCYVRSTNSSISLDYQKVLNEIHEFGKNSNILTEKPPVNTYALALRDDRWCRVKVLIHRRGNMYRIAFVDYGEISKRSLNDLRTITPSLEKLPCYIHMVQLKGVTKYSIETKILNSLLQYTNKEYKMEFVQADEAGGNVELYDWDTNTLLNSLIISTCNGYKDNESESSSLSNVNVVEKKSLEKTSFNGNSNTRDNKTNNIHESKCNGSENMMHDINMSTKKKMPSVVPRQIQIQKPCLVPPFEIKSINENDRNCKVVIMDDSCVRSGFIGCLLEKHLDNLKAITKFLKEYNVSDQAYKPKINEYCLATYENEWYRAKVVEIISDDIFLVTYIDFTNEMELSSESIRRYPMSLTYPCCTTLCAIDGLPEDMSDELKDYLESNCKMFTTLSIDSVRIVDDIQYLESKELLKKLHNSKLL